MYGMTLSRLSLPLKTGGYQSGLLTMSLWGRFGEFTVEMQVAPPISVALRAQHGHAEFGVFHVYRTLKAGGEKHVKPYAGNLDFDFILPLDYKAALAYFPKIALGDQTKPHAKADMQGIENIAVTLRDTYSSLVQAQGRLGLAWN